MKLRLVLLIVFLPVLLRGTPPEPVQVSLKRDFADKVSGAVAKKRLNKNETEIEELRRRLLDAMDNPEAAMADRQPFLTISIRRTTFEDLHTALKASKAIGDPALWELCRQFNSGLGISDDCDTIYNIHYVGLNSLKLLDRRFDQGL